MRGTLVRPAPVGRLRLSGARGQRLAGRLSWAAVWLAVLASLVPVALYVWAAAHRVGYPYELDWLEGGAVEMVSRVMDGRSLYVPPTLAYVPYTYPPLYSWVSAAVAEVTGIGFLPLRIVSVGSSLVAATALWKLIAGATGDRAAGMVGVGLFAATYGLTGWWFDVGRLDSMFVALTLVALWLGRHARTARMGVLVGVIAFLAFFTKQVAILALAPPLLFLLVMSWRAGVAALVTLAVLVVVSTLVLDATTGGWYRYYVFSELAGQPWEPREWRGFWRIDLYHHLRPIAWLVLIAAVAGAAGASHKRALAHWRAIAMGYGYEIAAALGLLAAAWLSRLHVGGYVNVLMPAYAAAALLGGIAFSILRRRGAAATRVAVGLVVVQLTGIIGSFAGAIPASGQSAAGAAVIARLRSLPGPVLILSHPWYGTLAGKGSFAQEDALEEVIRSAGPRGAAYLNHDLSDALDRYRIRAVVLDGPPPGWLAPQLDREFILQPAPLTRSALRDVGDVRTAPRQLYFRRSSG